MDFRYKMLSWLLFDFLFYNLIRFLDCRISWKIVFKKLLNTNVNGNAVHPKDFDKKVIKATLKHWAYVSRVTRAISILALTLAWIFIKLDNILQDFLYTWSFIGKLKIVQITENSIRKISGIYFFGNKRSPLRIPPVEFQLVKFPTGDLPTGICPLWNPLWGIPPNFFANIK